MFAKTIIDSDAFLDMPLSTQALYFHLSMRADDDGFINNPKRIQRTIGCGDDDLKLLIAKKFIICFESGVIVIKHWKLHNYIRNDRYKPTNYIEEKQQLSLKPNKAYTLNDSDGMPVGIPDGTQRDTQVRLGKDSIDKDSIELGEDSIEVIDVPDTDVGNTPPPEKKKKPAKHKYGEYQHVLLSDDDIAKLKAEYGEQLTDRAVVFLDEYIEMKGYKAKNHYLAIRKWVIDAVKEQQAKQNRSNGKGYMLSNGEATNNAFLADLDNMQHGNMF